MNSPSTWLREVDMNGERMMRNVEARHGDGERLFFDFGGLHEVWNDLSGYEWLVRSFNEQKREPGGETFKGCLKRKAVI